MLAAGHFLQGKTAARCLALALTLAACTHGPPQLMVKVHNARLEPGGSRVAVAVYYEKHRPPTGIINTFPNGGVPKVLEREARVYLCDLETLSVTLLAAIEPSASLNVSFNPWIAGWQDGSVILHLTGLAGTSLADYEKGLNEETYRVATGGGATRIEAVPEGLRDTPRDRQGAIEIGTGFQSVNVKRAPANEWLTLFRIDPTTGGLVAIRDI